MTKPHMSNPRARAEIRQHQAAYRRALELEQRQAARISRRLDQEARPGPTQQPA